MQRFSRPTIDSSLFLDHTSPKLDVHSKIKLFPHQQAVVHKMFEMESKSRNAPFVGVLKDPPGTGKSFAILAMILHEKRTYKRTQNLLVIPHNIHEQWLKYIADFSDELTCKSFMYYGDITTLFHEKDVLTENDILITTSDFYTMITETMVSLEESFNRVILDEIDSISFFTSAVIPSRNVWLVSASAELTKSGAYMEHAKNNTIMCDHIFIKRSINLPPPLLEHHQCYNEFVHILAQDVVPEIKAVYAADFTGFKFHYLRNEFITNPKELLSATFRDKCMALHSTLNSLRKMEDGAKRQKYLADSVAKKVAKREKLIKEIEHIVNLLVLRKCPMCCDDFAAKSERVDTPCCSTQFCKDCMKKWLEHEHRCPRCYEKITMDELKENTSLVAPVPEKSTCRDKMEEFEEILKKEILRENFRILIFSDYTGTFLKVQEILKRYNLNHSEIEGNQYTMNRAIKDYQTGKRPILLVDSQAYGAGMNMEMTTAVIIMHKTERESQVIGRAQRLGRRDILNVHHLLYPSE
jgi:SNF2 family DNA or RNA helicase